MHVETGEVRELRAWKMRIPLRRRVMIALAKWLRGQIRSTAPEGDCELGDALQEWLRIQVERYDQLTMGIVRCGNCGAEWEAMAYATTLKKLECPQCDSQVSEPMGKPGTRPPVATTQRDAARASTRHGA